MRIEVFELWAALVLIAGYITAALVRRGPGSDGLFRRGLLHLSIAFFMMEVVPPILTLINNDRINPKQPSDLLGILALVALIIAVLLYLNSLRLLCNWLLGDRGAP